MIDKLQAERDHRCNRCGAPMFGPREACADCRVPRFASLSSSQQVREDDELGMYCGECQNWDGKHDDDCSKAFRPATPASPSQPSCVAMTDSEIEKAYEESQGQTLRPQDRTRVISFARALLQSSPKGASKPQDERAVRNAALEEAATVCEAELTGHRYGTSDSVRRMCALKIRELKNYAPFPPTGETLPQLLDADTIEVVSKIARLSDPVPSNAAKQILNWMQGASQPSAASGRELPRALEFANHVINGVFEGGDWDGGDLQNLAIDYGLLKPAEMKERCASSGGRVEIGARDWLQSESQSPVVAEGWKLVPGIGCKVKANHPITVLNPEEYFEVAEVRAEKDGGFCVRGEKTCWFGLNGIAAQGEGT